METADSPDHGPEVPNDLISEAEVTVEPVDRQLVFAGTHLRMFANRHGLCRG